MNRIKNIKFAQFILGHKKLSVIAAVVLLVLGFIFYPKPQAPLEAVAVKKTSLHTSIAASGSVDSSSSVNLNFGTSGKVTYLGAKKGDRVVAGQVIASLDQRTAQKNYENALRDYAKQRNSFDQTKSDKGVTSIQDAQNDSVKRILEANQYDLEKAVTSVELQQLAKEASVLSTPIAGVLIRSDISTAGVNVGPTTTFTVADPESLLFKLDVDESDIGSVHLGQEVDISLDAYPDEPIHTTVTSIDFASHTTSTGGNAYTVETELPTSADDRYRIGMNGDAEIILNAKKNVLAVPLSSIVDDTYVYIQGEKEF